MIESKRWKQLVGPDQTHHLAIILFLPGRPTQLHTHDFPEVCWIERGVGEHTINGQCKRVEAGDLFFIRPEDLHVLRAVDDQGFTLINLAYSPSVRSDLLRRHPEVFSPLLSRKELLPHRSKLLPSAIAGLRQQTAALGGARSSLIAVEHFLLGLSLLVSPPVGPAAPMMPDWLQRACEEVQRPELFARGAPGLVRAAGRSAEHVARTVRTHLRMTPSEYVNAVRMTHAARELRVTNRAITDIALECGLSNLSHFYALFRLAHGQTPLSYRRLHHRTVA